MTSLLIAFLSLTFIEKIKEVSKEWVGMEDYYIRNFKRIHKLVSNARSYIQDKFEHAKFDDADINFIKQLEAEYYALEVIWVNMNEVETNRPRLEKNS